MKSKLKDIKIPFKLRDKDFHLRYFSTVERDLNYAYRIGYNHAVKDCNDRIDQYIREISIIEKIKRIFIKK